MSKGSYFVMGGVKGAGKFKRLFKRLILWSGKDDPHFLYLGAACGDEIKYKDAFQRSCLNVFPRAQVSSLNLSPVSPMSRSGHDKVERRFAEADLVYFDGGHIPHLRQAFEEFSLAEHCRSAHDGGADIGGLCGGGSFLAEKTVFHTSDEGVQLIDGAGLISGIAISCNIDDEEQREDRLKLLREASGQKGINQAIGMLDNQLVIFGEEEPLSWTEGEKTPTPLFC